MAIIKVNNTSEESSVNFLPNQSSILHTSDTNKITVNGVNVFVNKPKVGDIMCVTCYKDENGDVLPADQQQVKWIDGLSINPKYLSQTYEPVGICVAINGNKAMVRYREEKNLSWSAASRLEMPQLLPIINNKSHYFKMILKGKEHYSIFSYRYKSLSSTFEQESDFVDQLNDWFLDHDRLDRVYSAEIVDKDTYLPVVQDTGQYRIIVNVRYTENINDNNNNNINNDAFSMQMDDYDDNTTKITPTRATGKPVKAVNWCYINNGFTRDYGAGLCRAMYYNYVQRNQTAPISAMENIDSVPGSNWSKKMPARLVDFNDNDNCKILRDNFATYDKYFDSMMVNFQCGAGGVIAETPSGKENTYKLANCKFRNFTSGFLDDYSILYPAANWAASINVNGPNLGKGNWWLPSAAEMAQMMHDITYNTIFFGTNPDIVSRVLLKLTSITNSGWSMLSPNTSRWTSSTCKDYSAYIYGGGSGMLSTDFYYYNRSLPVAPITLYEF